ncbi:MAG: phosphoribosyltransferase family protein [Balneolaceae bacterium]
MTMENQPYITLMDNARIRRTLKRMIYQIAEKARERDVLLVGLNERGAAMTKEMESLMQNALDCPPDVAFFNLDDKNLSGVAASIREDHDFMGKMVVLVDDVIFSGKTMFTALQKLLADLECTVYIAVLIDRGHRRMPVQAEFVGREISTKPNEHVELILNEGKADRVLLYKFKQDA